MKTVALALFIIAGSPAIAHADALDGDWCSKEGEKLTIDGKIITTPAGRTIQGVYGRHRFQYTAPDGGWKSRKDIDIRQHSETRMVLKAGDEPETDWHPCENIS